MNSFYDCIFLKNNSSLEDKLKYLECNNIINKQEEHMLQMGINGEKQVAYHLSKSNIGMYVLRDVNLEINNLTAQIDFIVITSHHCYFIECKNYNSDIIHVDENANFEISSKYKNKYLKKGIKSPLSQADDQLTVLKKIFLEDKEEAKKILNGIKFKDYFKTLVVFTNPESRLDLKKAPYEIKYRILKVDNLIRQIEYDNNHYKGNRYNQEQMKKIADYILENNIEVDIKSLTPEYELKVKQKLKKKKIKKIILIILILYFIMVFLNIFSTIKNNNNNNIKNITLTDNQKQAISVIKTAYESSTQNGIELIHTSVCEELSNIFKSNKFDCDRYPLTVNVINDNKITIYKNNKCYILEISNDDEKISSAKTVNTSCNGVPISYLEWDETNEYYQKIGGIEKIREIAISGYNGTGMVSMYYTDDFIIERGGTSSYTIYSINVNMFFKALLNKGYISATTSTNKEETNKMCESLYYIMK